MHMTIIAGAFAALAAVQQNTDTTFAAAGATRLEINTQGGQITIRTWNRDQVRVQATHSSRTSVGVSRSGSVLSLRPRATRGAPGVVDYEVTVPESMGLDLSGMYTDISVDGSRGDVSATTVQGNIEVKGGRGRVALQSVNGRVLLDGAQGTLSAKSVSSSVRVSNSSGEVVAESVSGDVFMLDMNATGVDANTVSGRVHYRGSVKGSGYYMFSSHSGSVILDIPENVDASFSIATVSGTFRPRVQATLPANRRGRRFNFTLGSGTAKIEAESFSGDILIGPQPRSTNQED